MQPSKLLGSRRDLPLIPAIPIAAATAGTGTDYEHPIVVVQDLTKTVGSGEAGLSPLNSMELGLISIVPEAAITGTVTNFFTWNILQKRLGAILVSTSAPTTIVAGLATVTPASMANIIPGSYLVFAGGTGATETVCVIATTATTFQAVFVNGHSGGYTITSAPLASIAYVNTVNASLLQAVNLVPLAGQVLLPGDVVTIQRVSTGTGLASPAALVQIWWDSALNKSLR